MVAEWESGACLGVLHSLAVELQLTGGNGSDLLHAERRSADGGCGKTGVIIPSAADEGTAKSSSK